MNLSSYTYTFKYKTYRLHIRTHPRKSQVLLQTSKEEYTKVHQKSQTLEMT